MIKPTLLDAYFLDVATHILSHTDSNKRFAYNIDELKAGKRETHPCLAPTMALDEVRAPLEYNGGWKGVNSHGFWILKHVEKQDWANENVVVQECNAMAQKTLSKMTYEFANEGDTIMKFLDPRSMEVRKVGPELDTFFGVYVSYALRQTVDLTYNASDWT